MDAKYSALLSVVVALFASSLVETAKGTGVIGFMKESWIIGGRPKAMLKVLKRQQ